MDILYSTWREFQPIVLNVSVAAFVAPLDAVDLLDLIVVVQAHDKLTDHNVKAGTEPSAGDYGRLGLSWIAEEVHARPCLHELDRLCDILVVRVLLVHGHEQVVLHERVLG